MEIVVEPRLRRYLTRKVRDGQFRSPSEVVNFALDRLKSDEKDIEWLKREVQKGADSLDAGQVIPWNLEEQKTRLLRRVARQRRKSNGHH